MPKALIKEWVFEDLINYLGAFFSSVRLKSFQFLYRIQYKKNHLGSKRVSFEKITRLCLVRYEDHVEFCGYLGLTLVCCSLQVW